MYNRKREPLIPQSANFTLAAKFSKGAIKFYMLVTISPPLNVNNCALTLYGPSPLLIHNSDEPHLHGFAI